MRLSYFFIFAALFFSFSCGSELWGAQDQPPYKVVVLSHQSVTSTYSREEADLLAESFKRHWPDGRVVPLYFPVEHYSQPEKMRQILMELSQDPFLRAVILCEAPVGSIYSLAKLRAMRPELLIFALDPHEGVQKMAKAASLTFALNHSARSFIYPTQAQRMGARSLVFISFNRHMQMSHFARFQRIMSAVCRDLSMILITDLNGPDPLDPNVSREELEEHLHKTMSRYLGQYGPQTAFISSNTLYSELMVPIAMQNGGIILPAVQPSLSLGYPEALDLVEEARPLLGQWQRLLALEDEKIMALSPPGEFAVWTYPYPQTAVLAMAELATAAIESKINIYDLNLINSALSKFSPGAKWQVSTHLDYNTDALVPQVFLLLQDSYWFGHGYQGMTRLHIPSRYFRIR